jgi:hypothetical protein
MKYILFLNETGESEIDIIGQKGVFLATLFNKGFRVPPGFIITASVFDRIKNNKLIKQLTHEYSESNNPLVLDKIQDLIKHYDFPEDVADEIIEGYLSLSVDADMDTTNLLKSTEEFVAVRSCFIGKKIDDEVRHKTMLNVRGKDKLFTAILESYALNFVYELKKRNNDNFSFGVIVQKMIESQKSGVAYSVNEDNNNQILVKAIFGLGEGIRSGNVFPDTYVVDKNSNLIESIDIAQKQFEFVRDIDTDITVKNRLGEKSLKQVLYDREIKEVATLVKKLARELKEDQKVGWAIKGETIYVLQNRPLDNDEDIESIEMEIIGEPELAPEVIDIEENIDDDLEMFDKIREIESEEVETNDVNDDDEIENTQIIQQNETEQTIETQEVEVPIIEKEEQDNEIEEYDLFGIAQTEKDDEEQEGQEKREIIDETPSFEDVLDSNDDDEIDEKIEKSLFDENQMDNPFFETKEESNDKLQEEPKVEESIFSEMQDYNKFKVIDEPVEKESVSINKTKELALLNAGNSVVYCQMVIKERLIERLKKYVREIPDTFEHILNELLEYEPVDNEEKLRQIDKAKQNFVNKGLYPQGEDVMNALRLI